MRRNATFYSIEISAFEKRGPGKASEERSEGGGAMFGRPNVPSKQATQEKIRSQKNRGRRKPTCTDESSIISLRGYAKKIQQLFGKATQRIASMDMDEERKRCTVVGRPVARTERASRGRIRGPVFDSATWGPEQRRAKLWGVLPAKQSNARNS